MGEIWHAYVARGKAIFRVEVDDGMSSVDLLLTIFIQLPWSVFVRVLLINFVRLQNPFRLLVFGFFILLGVPGALLTIFLLIVGLLFVASLVLLLVLLIFLFISFFLLLCLLSRTWRILFFYFLLFALYGRELRVAVPQVLCIFSFD